MLGEWAEATFRSVHQFKFGLVGLVLWRSMFGVLAAIPSRAGDLCRSVIEESRS